MRQTSDSVISSLFIKRSDFIIIGLTGRTGSGCTTAANILEKRQPSFPSLGELNYMGEPYYKGLDRNRYNIVKKYTEANVKPFVSIKVSDLISSYLIPVSKEELAFFILESSEDESLSLEEVMKKLDEGVFSGFFAKKMALALPDLLEKKVDDVYPNSDFEIKKLLLGFKDFTKNFKKELDGIRPGLYVKVYQAAGNSIRKIGKVKVGYEIDRFDPTKVFHLPEIINKVIKLIRRVHKPAYVVIDAIRNPYEARFFKDRYSAFYLFSVNAPSNDRSDYLSKVRKFSSDDIDKIDEIESGKAKIKYSEFVSQDVKKCIEISDVHLFNPRNELQNNNILKSQLAWYVALMMHPGLITPTAMERVMQIAYTAKTNSGCISRQVGAVVTDKDNSIKAVGWNDVPDGQVPCSLRSIKGAINSFDDRTYSEYERSNIAFRDRLIEIKSSFPDEVNMNGRNLSYCFKDIKNSLDEKGNQVHTRSLHAEENAFLQITKYGGTSVKGGKLFTTASPCELCAKKAFQLGVDKIVYIDPYPGITESHIIANGSNRPKLVQFRGAVGKGYHQLYEQAIAYKDELAYFDDQKWKETLRSKKVSESINFLLKEGVLTENELAGVDSSLYK